MSTLLQKELLKDFSNIEKVAEGGMGEIYRAYDKEHNRTVAIKRFRTLSSHNQNEAKERLLREARVTDKLNHPNIASIYEIRDLDDEILIIRPFYKGQTLEETIQSSRLTITESLNIILQICSALEQAHDQNIVHRDIKSENIFILENGDAILMDFGLAKASDLFNEGLTQAGSILGTIDYIAPEGIKGLPTNHQADIWSLGVVLFEMLCGKKPFGSGHDISATMLNIVTQPTPPITENSFLEDIVHKTLAKNLSERYQSSSELASDLLTLVAGNSIQSTKTTFKVSNNSLLNKPTSSNSQTIVNNLDISNKDFIGRENEVKLINHYLTSPDSRLITILGSGGFGKTSLAKQIAHHQCNLPYFNDGIFLVNLESITSELGVPASIGKELGLNFSGDKPLDIQIVHYLKDKNILLILDNTEHLKSDLNIVADVLENCPDVKVLCTSRLRLTIENEWIVRLYGLNIPTTTPESILEAQNFNAIKFFEQKAQRVLSTFKLTKNNLESVITICTVLQGSPLAIELAASWIRLFEPQRILEEINSNLDFLGTSEDNGQNRNMRAVFNHSWDLLEPYQRLCLAKLAIFKGGFYLSAAEAICDIEKPDVLHELADAFLLQETEDNHFDLQPLIKQYVGEKLRSASSLNHITSQKHSTFYTERVVSVSTLIRTKKQNKCLADIEKDLENIKSAWFWSLESNNSLDLTSFVISAEVLKRFFLSKCRFKEGINFFEVSIKLLESEIQYSQLIGHFKAHLAGLKLTTNNLDSVQNLAQEAFMSLIKVRDLQGTMLPLSILGICEARNGNHLSAKRYFKQSVAIAIQYSKIDQATHISNLAIAEQYLGNYQKCEFYNEKALYLAKKFQLSGQELTLSNNLANLMLVTNQTVKAIMYLEDSLRLAEELNSQNIIPYININLGNVYFQLKDYAQAKLYFEKALTHARSHEQIDIEIPICAEIGRVHLASKNKKLAKEFLLESLELGLKKQHIQHSLKALIYWSQYLIIEKDLDTSASILLFVKANAAVAKENIELVEKILSILSKKMTPNELEEATQKAQTYEVEALLESILTRHKYSILNNLEIESSSLLSQL